MSTRIENPKKYAEDNNLDVVFSDKNTIQVDADEDFDDKHFIWAMGVLRPILGLRIKKVTESKSKNRHYYPSSAMDLTPEQRIMIQALLGSDLKREVLNYKGTTIGDEILFFEARV